MSTMEIEIKVKELTCCVCSGKMQLQPTVIELQHPFDDTKREWVATSSAYPPSWKTVGGETVCPDCWVEFGQFAAARRTKIGGGGGGQSNGNAAGGRGNGGEGATVDLSTLRSAHFLGDRGGASALFGQGGSGAEPDTTERHSAPSGREEKKTAAPPREARPTRDHLVASLGSIMNMVPVPARFTDVLQANVTLENIGVIASEALDPTSRFNREPGPVVWNRFSEIEKTGETFNKVFHEIWMAAMGRPLYSREPWESLNTALERSTSKEQLEDILTSAFALSTYISSLNS